MARLQTGLNVMQFVLPYSGLQWSDLPFMLEGAWRTIMLTIMAGSLGTLLGVIVGWLRETFVSFRIGLIPFIDVIRSVPLIIQFILVNSFQSILGLQFDPFWIGVVTLSIYMAVLTSELVRAGLQSVRPELSRAGRSLGMSYWQGFLHIRAPLAIRTALPGWIGALIALTKDTALVSVIGYIELLRAAQVLINRSNEALLILAGVGLFYFVICYPVSLYARRLERRLAI
ncbi:amino acid ABC transporter permease [Chelatococcus asaccharovorans]|uniref:Amino acid ABC transporter membrane protein 2 (PAAT family) n=1 Tax=Chelatococcus asaccharovorans TaxID=28210 RepID=A0A2V3UID4_9HYPH|nr:amino acid ABC transporter permease [Chelatococcus asaccharovorans]PXW65071.1 amino acid ABC transporter membrane protein 2 (PAAT family) [Chelatococcus asaccharovorans]